MESGKNFEDFIRKPEEFGKCKETREIDNKSPDKSKNGEAGESHTNFEDYIRNPGEFGGENRIIDNNIEEIFEDDIGDKTKENKSRTEDTGNTFNGERNFDDYIREPYKWTNNADSDGSLAGNVNEIENRNGSRNEEKLKIEDERIVFPDDKVLEESKEDELRNKVIKDDTIVFPDK